MSYSSNNEYRQIVGNTFPSVVYVTFGGNWYASFASSSTYISHILYKARPWGPSRPSTWNCIHISWRNQLTGLQQSADVLLFILDILNDCLLFDKLENKHCISGEHHNVLY